MNKGNIILILGCLVSIVGLSMLALYDLTPKFKPGDCITLKNLEEWDNFKCKVLKVGKYKYLLDCPGFSNKKDPYINDTDSEYGKVACE